MDYRYISIVGLIKYPIIKNTKMFTYMVNITYLNNLERSVGNYLEIKNKLKQKQTDL